MNRVLIILILIISSCQVQDIEPLLRREVVVVEGWVSTEMKQHWVKLSRTVPFEASLSETPIEDAVIEINDLVETYTLDHAGDGIYLTPNFSGTIGRRYVLTIRLSNGDVITSTSERLNPVPDIENISFDSFIESDPETGDDIEIHYPVVTTTDPIAETNYYRYFGFRNEELLNLPAELEILSDRFINGQSLSHNIPTFRYDLGDECVIELHSLSESGYDFFELLKSQTTSIGSSSGTAPASLVGNLTYDDKNELVLGYFGASDVKSISSTVQ